MNTKANSKTKEMAFSAKMGFTGRLLSPARKTFDRGFSLLLARTLPSRGGHLRGWPSTGLLCEPRASRVPWLTNPSSTTRH